MVQIDVRKWLVLRPWRGCRGPGFDPIGASVKVRHVLLESDARIDILGIRADHEWPVAGLSQKEFPGGLTQHFRGLKIRSWMVREQLGEPGFGLAKLGEQPGVLFVEPHFPVAAFSPTRGCRSGFPGKVGGTQ